METFNDMIAEASSDVVVYDANPDLGAATIDTLQIPSGHMLGALILNTGGLLVSGGLRFLGSPKVGAIRSIMPWNEGLADISEGSFLLVTDDIYGGFYAANLGYFDGEMGEVFALFPDETDWVSIADKFTDFLNGVLHGYFDKITENFTGSCEGIDIGYDQAISYYPPL